MVHFLNKLTFAKKGQRKARADAETLLYRLRYIVIDGAAAAGREGRALVP